MILRTIKTFLIIYILSSLTLHSQVISKIQISGNKIFSESEYSNWINISIGAKIFPSLKDSIKVRTFTALKDRGYLSSSFNVIEFEKIDSSNIALHLEITEGEQTQIDKISFTATPKDSTLITKIISQLNDAPFTKVNLESVFAEVLNYYENKGYPFASVNLEAIELKNDSSLQNPKANLLLTISEGNKSTIDRIEIIGNEKTKDYVITRILQIFPGEEYSQKKIDAVQGRINRLRFFDNVEPPVFYSNSKKEGVLKISVKEKQTNNFDGIAGYVPAVNDKESGYLTGYININIRNLFGTGRSASLRWQQENRFSQELELRYLEPWLFGYPFNLEFGLFQRKQDSTYVQRNVEGRLEFLATQETSASVLITSQSTIPSQLQSNIFTVYNSTSLSTGINLKIDTRDDFYAPTQGIFFSNTYSYVSKKISDPANYITPNLKTEITLQRLEFDFNIFKQFFKQQVAALGVHARELRGSDFEISDLYFLGGTNSLRGYREKQFQGNRTIWSNFEYRFLLSLRSYAFLFFDSGYFLRNEDSQRNIPENSAFKTGYGFGLNIETSLGVLGVSFALGKGDSLSEGKIHFGIKNEF